MSVDRLRKETQSISLRYIYCRRVFKRDIFFKVFWLHLSRGSFVGSEIQNLSRSEAEGKQAEIGRAGATCPKPKGGDVTWYDVTAITNCEACTNCNAGNEKMIASRARVSHN